MTKIERVPFTWLSEEAPSMFRAAGALRSCFSEAHATVSVSCEEVGTEGGGISTDSFDTDGVTGSVETSFTRCFCFCVFELGAGRLETCGWVLRRRRAELKPCDLSEYGALSYDGTA